MKYLFYAGVDFHKNTSNICVINQAGEIIEQVRIKSGLLLVWFSNRKDYLIGIESSCGTFDICDKLKAQGHAVEIISALHFRALGLRGKKNDKTDARILAECLRIGAIHPVYQRGVKARELRSVLSSRDFLVRQRTSLMAHVRGTLREYGISMPLGVTEFEENVRQKALEIQNPLLREMLMFCIEQIEQIKGKEWELESLLKAQAKEDELVTRLIKIPGIGILTALALITAIEDPSRFKDKNHLGSYLGLTPKESSSGNKVRFGRINKAGQEMVRRYLIHGARATMRYSPKSEHDQRRWADKLEKRIGFNKTVVALARKNAIIAWQMMKTGQNYNEHKEVVKVAA